MLSQHRVCATIAYCIHMLHRVYLLLCVLSHILVTFWVSIMTYEKDNGIQSSEDEMSVVQEEFALDMGLSDIIDSGSGDASNTLVDAALSYSDVSDVA